MQQTDMEDDGLSVARPKTLDDFRNWDEVHASRDGEWRQLMSEASKEEHDRVMERVDEGTLKLFLDHAIPPKDRFADLKTLQPSEKSQMPVAFQARILEEMHKQDLLNWRARRKVYGWAFFGPAGWSKSTLCTAWFAQYARANITSIDEMRNHHSLWDMIEHPKNRTPECMWRMNALALIDEHAHLLGELAVAIGQEQDVAALLRARPFIHDERIVHRDTDDAVDAVGEKRRRQFVVARHVGG